MGKNKKVTIYDLAEALNISAGTVNRALHNKPRISPETKQRVLDMAVKMNFSVSHAAQSLGRDPIRIGCILCCPVPQYLNEVKRGMEAAFAELLEFNVLSDIHVLEGANSDQYFSNIQEITSGFIAQKYNAVILFLSGDNSQFRPMIAQLKAEGIETATVTNDVRDSDRVISVTVDGRCAGKLAAELLHLCCPNESVAILTGNRLTEIHRDNVDGFLSYSQKHPFKSVSIYEHNDQPYMVEQKVEEAIAENRNISGIYSTSASSALVCRQIERLGYTGRIKIITTDLFEETRELLQREIACATIFQDPYRQGKDVVRRIYRYLFDGTGEGQFLITPQAVFSSNMTTI